VRGRWPRWVNQAKFGLKEVRIADPFKKRGQVELMEDTLEEKGGDIMRGETVRGTEGTQPDTGSKNSLVQKEICAGLTNSKVHAGEKGPNSRWGPLAPGIRGKIA